MAQPPDALVDDDAELDDAGEAPAAVGLEPPPAVAFQAGVAEHGQRLDRALAAWVPRYSRSHLQSLVDAGSVRVGGVECRSASRKLRAGDTVEVVLWAPAAEQAFSPEPMPIDVCYEDEHLRVLCKPAGLVVHPAAGNWHGTLLQGLLALDPGAADLPRAGIVHRLDKDTSGLMVVARTREAMTGLVRAIAGHEVQREYLAIVHGALAQAAMTIDAPIGRDPVSRIRMAVRPAGKPARTDVERLALCAGHGPLPGATNAGFTAVRCRLHTGRTHQIRVHLADRGHPIVGDQVYGGKPVLGLQRQALHAERLAFAHPVTGKAVAITAAPPDDFAAAWAAVLQPR